jgi:hypothetical protein
MTLSRGVRARQGDPGTKIENKAPHTERTVTALSMEGLRFISRCLLRANFLEFACSQNAASDPKALLLGAGDVLT